MTLRQKILFILPVLVFFSSQVSAQFWFGPIIGGHMNAYDFLASQRRDSVNVPVQFNFHAGLAMDYSTESAFEVHTELKYTRRRAVSKVEGKQPVPNSEGFFLGDSSNVIIAESDMVHHFLTMPVMARVVLVQRSKVKLMLEVGPEISYWLGSKSKLKTDEMYEAAIIGEGTGRDFLETKVKFSDLEDVPIGGENYGTLYVTNANRLQYALGIGAGAVWDINEERRLIVSAKFTYGHSIMSFNDGNFLSGVTDYTEDTEYQTHTLAVSAAYMFGWNPMLNRRGRSTSGVGKKQRRRR